MVRSSSIVFSCTETTVASQTLRYGSSRKSSSAKERHQGDAENDQGARGEKGERRVGDIRHVRVGRHRRRAVVVLVVAAVSMAMPVAVVVLREMRVEVLEEVVGDFFRRGVDQAGADLRQLAAHAGLDVVG